MATAKDLTPDEASFLQDIMDNGLESPRHGAPPSSCISLNTAADPDAQPSTSSPSPPRSPPQSHSPQQTPPASAHKPSHLGRPQEPASPPHNGRLLSSLPEGSGTMYDTPGAGPGGCRLSSAPSGNVSARTPRRSARAAAAAPLVSNAEALLLSIGALEAKLQAAVTERGATGGGVLPLAEQLCRAYNSAAMKLAGGAASRGGGSQEALGLLQKAQVLTEAGGVLATNPALQQRLLAITHNNLGCYHTRRGDPSAALTHLSTAANIERAAAAAVTASGGDSSRSGGAAAAGTLLNIAAALSALGRHADALSHAQDALTAAAAGAGVVAGPELEESLLHPPIGVPSSGEPLYALRHASADAASLLCMAHFSCAVEMEYVGHHPEALHAYNVAAALAARQFGRGAALALSFSQALGAFRLKLSRLQRVRNPATSPFSGSSSARPATSPAVLGAPLHLDDHLSSARGWHSSTPSPAPAAGAAAASSSPLAANAPTFAAAVAPAGASSPPSSPDHGAPTLQSYLNARPSSSPAFTAHHHHSASAGQPPPQHGGTHTGSTFVGTYGGARASLLLSSPRVSTGVFSRGSSMSCSQLDTRMTPLDTRLSAHVDTRLNQAARGTPVGVIIGGLNGVVAKPWVPDTLERAMLARREHIALMKIRTGPRATLDPMPMSV